MTEDLMQYPKLLGDIGGTNVRLALKLAPEAAISHVLSLTLRDHASAEEAVAYYLAQVGAITEPMRPRTGCLGVAGPVLGDYLKLFNAPWGFSIEGLRQAVGLSRLRVINDFTALALSLPGLPQDELVQIGGQAPVSGMAMGVIGAGTGLGVSGLIPGLDGHWSPVAGEGGHITLAAANEDEARLIALLRARFGHVSAERVLSGSGLVVLYEAHAQLAGKQADAGLQPSDITDRGLSGECALSVAALNSFCLFMGTAASNLAVTLGTQGGLFIGGGIVPRLGGFFERSGFRRRFDEKGRYSGYLSAIPVFVIHSPFPGLIGASRA